MCQLFQACRLCFNMTGIRFKYAPISGLPEIGFFFAQAGYVRLAISGRPRRALSTQSPMAPRAQLLLHGSGASLTALPCFRAVFSDARGSAAMHLCGAFAAQTRTAP